MSTKNWRTYERHPISARYPDIKGEAFNDFCANTITWIRIGARSVILYEGKVLDGWQFLRACIVNNKEPTFTNFPDGEDPEEFVEQANEHRRHESLEKMEERLQARRARVAKMRTEGKNIRTIADAENTSPKSIQRDLESSGVAAATRKWEGLITTGKDGKRYISISPPKKPRGNKKKRRCRRIQFFRFPLKT